MAGIVKYEALPAASKPEGEKKPDRKAELADAFAKSTKPCTALSTLGIPPREKLLGDWFMEGDLGFIFAPRGLGKTWLSLGMATAISSGRACGPWQSGSPRPVLYVDGEMPLESIDSRIRGMGGADNLFVLNHEALFHLCGKVLNLTDPDAQAALLDYLLAKGIKVLVLDNLSCLFSGMAENDADAWEMVLGWLLTLRRHRIAVVLVHHSGRNGAMRGTSRREDAAFWVLRLDEIQDASQRQGARFLSRFVKDRNSQVEQEATEWSFRTRPDGTVEITHRPASNQDVFRQWIEDGLTRADEIAREMGLSKGTISKMARRAMEAGWLEKKGRDYKLVSRLEGKKYVGT